MAKLLLVDPDPVTSKATVKWLEAQKNVVETATDAAACKRLLARYTYDVIVLDWSSPSETGIEICKWYRSRGGNSPIIILTNASEIDATEMVFGAGADDCMTKPIDLRELTVRVRALLRRNVSSLSRLVELGPLTIDSTMHSASIAGRMLNLTATEFSLLEYLVRHPNKIVNAKILLHEIWRNQQGVSCDTVRAYVMKLRQKSEEVGYSNLIENVYGIGYRINTNVAKLNMAPQIVPRFVAC